MPSTNLERGREEDFGIPDSSRLGEAWHVHGREGHVRLACVPERLEVVQCVERACYARSTARHAGGNCADVGPMAFDFYSRTTGHTHSAALLTASAR